MNTKSLLKLGVLICLFLLIYSFSYSQQILPEKDRARVIDEILEDRFKNLLPELMDKTGIDMWIIISREYNEDPVLKTMLPSLWLNARRRTILVFYRNKEKNIMERMAVARYDVGKSITRAWNKDEEPNQCNALIKIINDRDPKNIGLNYSEHFEIADGITKTDYGLIMSYLPKKYHERVKSAEELAVGWIETRTSREMLIYEQLSHLTHSIIREAFSNKVITPGITTTEDVVWWMRQKLTDMGLDTWFHPTVDVQRSGKSDLYSFDNNQKLDVIRAGDLLHCDFGINYLRLNTDCQELAYVLNPGETEAPKELIEALKKGNRVQDILTSHFRAGRSGNEILKEALKQARAEGLRPQIYSHPLGSYGHSAGTTIGMWDAQEGIPGSGNYGLRPQTLYAIELNTLVYIKEWDKDVRVMLEEPGFFGDNTFYYPDGRQTELILVK